MNKTTFTVIIAVTVLGIGAYFLATSDNPKTSVGKNDGMMGMTPEMMASMRVATDKEFIEGMIPHHQEAVDTAREVLARGGEIPAIRALAQSIIVSQEQEIAMMKSWYEDWYDKPYQDTGRYMNMMRPLAAYSGQELDRVFTTDMIVHHQGAVMMANMALTFSERDEIRDLSESTIESQQKEIALMQAVLDDAPEQTLAVQVRDRKLEPSVVTVTEGDVVTLQVTTDESGEFHISGYDIENDMEVGETLEFAFLAHQPGRYNFELHPSEDEEHVGEEEPQALFRFINVAEASEDEGEDIVIGAFVVNPR